LKYIQEQNGIDRVIGVSILFYGCAIQEEFGGINFSEEYPSPAFWGCERGVNKGVFKGRRGTT